MWHLTESKKLSVAVGSRESQIQGLASRKPERQKEGKGNPTRCYIMGGHGNPTFAGIWLE